MKINELILSGNKDVTRFAPFGEDHYLYISFYYNDIIGESAYLYMMGPTEGGLSVINLNEEGTSVFRNAKSINSSDVNMCARVTSQDDGGLL